MKRKLQPRTIGIIILVLFYISIHFTNEMLLTCLLILTDACILFLYVCGVISKNSFTFWDKFTDEVKIKESNEQYTFEDLDELRRRANGFGASESLNNWFKERYNK